MSLFDGEKTGIIDAGVDWITATALEPHTAGILEFRAHRLMDREKATGGLERSWGQSGFIGKSAGGIDWGVSQDGCLVRLRSTLAAQHWRSVAEIASNVSRVDMQITLRPSRPLNQVLAKNYREVKRARKENKRAPQGERKLTTEGAGTVYVGRRSSHFFGRIYDKGVESGMDHFRNCLRYEVEVKGAPANTLVRLLANTPSEIASVARETVLYFRSRRVSVGLAGRSLGLAQEDGALLGGADWWSVSRTKADSRRQLDWLRSQVRPCVARLINHGLSAQVYEALDLEQPAGARVVHLKQVS